MFRALIIAVTISATPVFAQDAEQHMTLEWMGQIGKVLDEDVNITPSGFEFAISDVPVLIVADLRANRMRAMVPISYPESMTPAELERLMQANFDNALDARYAIAMGRLRGVFIHPLKEPERDQLISGIAQRVNVAQT